MCCILVGMINTDKSSHWLWTEGMLGKIGQVWTRQAAAAISGLCAWIWKGQAERPRAALAKSVVDLQNKALSATDSTAALPFFPGRCFFVLRELLPSGWRRLMARFNYARPEHELLTERSRCFLLFHSSAGACSAEGDRTNCYCWCLSKGELASLMCTTARFKCVV